MTAEEILLKHSTTLTDGTILCTHQSRIKAMIEFANLNLDNAIKEWTNHIFRCSIDKESPMNYEDWLKHYKIRNGLK
jgi:hypothetical protein